VGYRGPAYSDDTVESVALDAVSRLAFGENSPLYQKLVIAEQKVDALRAGSPDNLDPELFTVIARVKNPADLDAVERQIVSTAQEFAAAPIDEQKLNALKAHVRYDFALRLDNSEAIAQTAAAYVALRRTPESANSYFDMYAKLTVADIRKVAKKYLVESGRTVVTLTGASGDHPPRVHHRCGLRSGG
jgi:zinc protease